MTQPSKSTSKLVDSGDNGQIGERGAAVTAAAAATATNPTAPAAYTAADISTTYVEAEVQAVADALEALRDEVATYEIAISALLVDANLNRTATNALIERLEAHGLVADN